MFGAMWSEHCAYKHSRTLLRRLPSTVLAGPRRAGRERRRDRHRRRAGGRVQGRVAQPSERGRAVPGRGDRRRRHHPRHLHHGRPPDRAAQLPALRPARPRCRDRRDRRRAQPLPVRRRRRRHRRLRQLHRHPGRRRRGRLRRRVLGQSARQRDVRRHRAARRDHAGAGDRRRQRAPARRRGHRPRWHPGRLVRLGDPRRRPRGAAPGGAGRQPVPREAADRGVRRAGAATTAWSRCRTSAPRGSPARWPS